MRFSITLVHGTWAKGAKWVRPGSALREALHKELAQNGIDVRFAHPPFEWRGANTHGARRDGRMRLEAYLKAQLLAYPGDRHFLIAHSHAGNLVFQCLRRAPDLATAISGVVTLATPFLRFRPREPFFAYFPLAIDAASEEIKSKLPYIFAFAVVTLVLLPVTLFVAKGQDALNRWVFGLCNRLTGTDCLAGFKTGAIALASLVTVAIIASLLFDGYRSARAKHRKTKSRRFRRILHEFGYFQPRGVLAQVPILSCSSSIDEAMGALRGSWWLHGFSSLAARIGSLLALLGVIALSLSAYVMVLDATFSILITNDDLTWVVLAVTALLLLLLLVVVSKAAAWLLRIGSAAPGLGLGWADSNRYVKVRAMREIRLSPLHENRRFSAWSLLSASHRSLFHSRLYASPIALEAIADWMCGVLRRQGQGFELSQDSATSCRSG